jgi:DNA-binding XRE family transcriptional regulator
MTLWFYRLIKRFFILLIEYYRVLRFLSRMIKGSQIRAARAMLGWSQQDLADKALLSETAVLKLETERADTRTSTILKVRKSLEEAGIDFITRTDGAVGVLLKPVGK